MALTEIIYSILIISSFLFVIVVITSFIISKVRRSVRSTTRSTNEIEIIPNHLQVQNSQTRLMREDQKNISTIRSLNSPIHQHHERKEEINIIRISNSQKTKLSIGQIEERNSNGKGLRYSIVNEKVKNLNSRAANFYL